MKQLYVCHILFPNIIFIVFIHRIVFYFTDFISPAYIYIEFIFLYLLMWSDLKVKKKE